MHSRAASVEGLALLFFCVAKASHTNKIGRIGDAKQGKKGRRNKSKEQV